MRYKIPSEIIQLALSDASYEGCGVSITPTLINFFFGNNGTGKSTVARTIKAGESATYTVTVTLKKTPTFETLELVSGSFIIELTAVAQEAN